MARLGRSFPIKPHMNNKFRLFLPNNWLTTLTETVTNTDALIRSITRNITETITSTDVFASLKVIAYEILESVTVVDNLVRSITRSIIETVTSTDAITRSIQKVVAEAITATDVLTSQVVKLLILYEKLTLLEDFRMFLNSKVARWRDKDSSKTNDWVEKTDL